MLFVNFHFLQKRTVLQPVTRQPVTRQPATRQPAMCLPAMRQSGLRKPALCHPRCQEFLIVGSVREFFEAFRNSLIAPFMQLNMIKQKTFFDTKPSLHALTSC